MKELLAKIRENLTGDRLRRNGKKALQFIANPRLILCFMIGWMITNGWSYILFGLGTYFGVEWMIAVGGAYMALLWLPFTPEKIFTCAIAIGLLRWLFPGDQKTLAVLRGWYERGRAAFQARRQRRAEKKAPAEESGEG